MKHEVSGRVFARMGFDADRDAEIIVQGLARKVALLCTTQGDIRSNLLKPSQDLMAG